MVQKVVDIKQRMDNVLISSDTLIPNKIKNAISGGNIYNNFKIIAEFQEKHFGSLFLQKSQAQPSPSVLFEGITFVNNMFFAYGPSLAWSSDGKTWTECENIDYLNTWNAPQYLNGLFVSGGVGDTTSSGIGLAWSSDGKTWTRGSVSSEITNDISTASWDSPIYANGIFVSGGAGLAWSSDGKTWTLGSIDGEIATNITYDSPIYANGVFVCGKTTTSSSRGISWSSDGKTWTKASHFVSKCLKPVYINNLFWICDNNDLLQSSDGKTWTTISKPSGIITFNGSPVGDANVLVTSGRNSTTSSHYQILWSSDGISWNLTSESIYSSNYMPSFVYLGDLFVGAGTFSFGDASKSCWSINGKEWFAGVNSDFSSGSFFPMKFCNGIFIAEHGVNSDFAYWSSDGKVWYKDNSGYEGKWLCAYGNGIIAFLNWQDGSLYYAEPDTKNLFSQLNFD